MYTHRIHIIHRWLVARMPSTQRLHIKPLKRNVLLIRSYRRSTQSQLTGPCFLECFLSTNCWLVCVYIVWILAAISQKFAPQVWCRLWWFCLFLWDLSHLGQVCRFSMFVPMEARTGEIWRARSCDCLALNVCI